MHRNRLCLALLGVLGVLGVLGGLIPRIDSEFGFRGSIPGFGFSLFFPAFH
jgi:hypothetical protein